MKKKHLFWGLTLLLFGSCTKEHVKQINQPEENSKNIQQNLVNPGGGPTIVYDANLGKYRANFGGAELTFDAVPNNTTFIDNDIANVSGMNCTNCSDFIAASGGRFVATIPTAPISEWTEVRKKVTDYNSAYNNFITGAIDPVTHEFKQQSFPNFPVVSSTYSAAVSGVIVRSHSAASTCVIYGSTFMPNPPPKNPDVPFLMGSIESSTHPSLIYDFYGAPVSNVITNVKAPALTLTWIGTYTTFTDGTGKHYKVTVTIKRDGVVYDQFTNYQLSDGAL